LSPDKNNPKGRLAVKITPNAGRNEVTGFKEGVPQIKIAAPPEKGKANKELVDFLSERLEVRKSSILIIKGQTSRNKVVSIETLSNEEIMNKLR
jgi:uncharacterized protein (TIGR00251 family)